MFDYAEQLDRAAAGHPVAPVPAGGKPALILTPEDVTDVDAFWASIRKLMRGSALLGGVNKLIWYQHGRDLSPQLSSWSHRAQRNLTWASYRAEMALGGVPRHVQDAVSEAHREVETW